MPTCSICGKICFGEEYEEIPTPDECVPQPSDIEKSYRHTNELDCLLFLS